MNGSGNLLASLGAALWPLAWRFGLLFLGVKAFQIIPYIVRWWRKGGKP